MKEFLRTSVLETTSTITQRNESLAWVLGLTLVQLSLRSRPIASPTSPSHAYNKRTSQSPLFESALRSEWRKRKKQEPLLISLFREFFELGCLHVYLLFLVFYELQRFRILGDHHAVTTRILSLKINSWCHFLAFSLLLSLSFSLSPSLSFLLSLSLPPSLSLLLSLSLSLLLSPSPSLSFSLLLSPSLSLSLPFFPFFFSFISSAE